MSNNVTEKRFSFGSITILYSYDTPVAIHNATEKQVVITMKKWSKTTSKHIKKFVEKFQDCEVKRAPQQFIDDYNILQAKLSLGITT